MIKIHDCKSLFQNHRGDVMDPLKIPLVRSPVFVLSDNASDYASMGSGEFDSDGTEKENNDKNNDDTNKFKSSFAKELNERITKNDMSEYTNKSFTKSRFDEILDKTMDFENAQEDFLRVKQENARLRFEIEKHKHEEKRYNKLQDEIEHLTSKLSKVNNDLYFVKIIKIYTIRCVWCPMFP